MKKNKFSKNWVVKKNRDLYYIKSKSYGFRSRSAFKLIEMNKKFKLFKKNFFLLDLGSFPGGWSQVASQEITQGKILAVDMALAKHEIKDAIVDGKQQIHEASNKLDQFEKENTTLRNELAYTKASQVLGELSAKLPEHKKKYVRKVLCDKSAEFILENFDYTLELLDKGIYEFWKK